MDLGVFVGLLFCYKDLAVCTLQTAALREQPAHPEIHSSTEDCLMYICKGCICVIDKRISSLFNRCQ